MKISTLGPKDTNSEFATEYYLRNNSIDGSVELYDTPEIAIEALISGNAEKTILCVVYPDLNEIVFKNLYKIRMTELFHFNTDNMVVASNKHEIETACSHPAPKDLLKGICKNVTLVTSNSKAAQLVANNEFQACVTTNAAARKHNLKVIQDFGPVSMGWAVFERS
jgi:prephenate dehydratase